MPAKSVLHACQSIHIEKKRKEPLYRHRVDPRTYAVLENNDYTLCGVNATAYWWRRKPVVIAEGYCPRKVTCKSCIRSMRSRKKSNTK